jgi:hypothetical protein
MTWRQAQYYFYSKIVGFTVCLRTPDAGSQLAIYHSPLSSTPCSHPFVYLTPPAGRPVRRALDWRLRWWVSESRVGDLRDRLLSVSARLPCGSGPNTSICFRSPAIRRSLVPDDHSDPRWLLHPPGLVPIARTSPRRDVTVVSPVSWTRCCLRHLCAILPAPAEAESGSAGVQPDEE